MQLEKNTASTNKSVRICAAQYLMKPIRDWDEIEKQVAYFGVLAEKYQSDFLLLPEYFGIQLFSAMPEDWSDKKRLKALTEKHDLYLRLLKTLSKKHNLYIVGGSHPVQKEDGKIYNVAHFFTPSGNVYTQDKLHITPTEQQTWDYQAGNQVKLFDTPFGRIGIQICYDIEFPEIARLMALNGVEIIFIPFYTADLFGYQRVRFSAQSRAIENYLYSVISGSTGNLGAPSNPMCYSQSAILTPSDVGFPRQCVAAEAEPNMQTVVVADLNLAILRDLRLNGTVQPLIDRREDLYSLELSKAMEIIEID